MYKFIICFIAGIGAGLGTGFAGMSAAAVISPMLITFLGLPAYEAVGIALASDVLASAVSAYTYGKNKNLDVRNGLVMMGTVLVCTLLGSFVASKVPNTAMGNFSVFMTLLLGIKFIVKPVMTTKETMNQVSGRKRIIQSVVCGIMVGFICGFVGAGAGDVKPCNGRGTRRAGGRDSWGKLSEVVSAGFIDGSGEVNEISLFLFHRMYFCSVLFAGDFRTGTG